MAVVYYRKLQSHTGPPTLDARMVIGAVIIKHMLNIDDREVVQQIAENMYLQYFVGFSSFQTEPPFDPSLLVSIRKRLGMEAMEELNRIILEEAGVLGGTDGSNREKTHQGNRSKNEGNVEGQGSSSQTPPPGKAPVS
ncbi:MAG: transposase, partial [Bacteroidota bacterium]|nr:transposase [Bacteroidota bacterium]